MEKKHLEPVTPLGNETALGGTGHPSREWCRVPDLCNSLKLTGAQGPGVERRWGSWLGVFSPLAPCLGWPCFPGPPHSSPSTLYLQSRQDQSVAGKETPPPLKSPLISGCPELRAGDAWAGLAPAVAAASYHPLLMPGAWNHTLSKFTSFLLLLVNNQMFSLKGLS